MILLALLTAAAIDTPLKPGDYTRFVQSGGLKREYLLHVPSGYDGKKQFPVVLAFHGGGSNAKGFVRFSGLNDTADKSGFLVVYPQGTGLIARIRTWNGGKCCGYAMKNKIDDVDFVRKLLDDLEKVANVNRKRVYATGMSNGAIVSYYLANKLADRIAAIAPVGAPMMTETCNPKRPVPVIHFHGTDDAFAPFKGGRGKGISGTKFYSVDHSIKNWIKANGCNDKPKIEHLKPKVDDGTKVTRKTWSGGKNGAEIVLVVIDGGGHTWPGGPSRIQFLGKTTRNVSANEAMWEFFQKHPMK